MLAERLDKAWRVRQASVPIDALMKFTAEGLVLGAGTLLAPRSATGRDIQIAGQETRVLTLLSAAHLRPVRSGSLNHLHRAAERWSEGQEDLAFVHLALSRVQRLEQPGSAAQRLFLADSLMQAGITPQAILRALHIDPSLLGPFDKGFDPNQPRVPAGRGRPSGQWTIGSSGATRGKVSIPVPPPRQVEAPTLSATDNSPSQAVSATDFGAPASATAVAEGASRASGAWLTTLSGQELIALGAAALAIGGSGALINLAVITNAALRKEGVISGDPPLRYLWHSDERALILAYSDNANVQHTIETELGEDGFFRDQKGRVVGRRLPDGTMMIDRVAIFPQTAVKSKEPDECPEASLDRPHKNGVLFENFMKEIVNPGNPTPTLYGYKFTNPLTARDVIFDDCQHRSGVLFDYKGPNYIEKLASRYDGLRDGFTTNLIDQAERQIDASEGRTIIWIFAEPAAAEKVTEIFAKNDRIRSRILIGSYPWASGGK